MLTDRPGRAPGEGAVYDMYPWNQSADSRDGALRAGPSARYPAQATRAVQVALDRRDNGGDSAASPDQ
jgi:hypothetical protein